MKQNTKEMNVMKRGYYQRGNGKVRLVTLYTTEEMILKKMVNIKENKNSKPKVVSINLFDCLTIQ
jgi:RNA 3'-terminal phosphate cyclase